MLLFLKLIQMLLWPASPLHQHLLIGPSIISKQIVERTIAYNGELMISRLLFFATLPLFCA